MGADFSGYATKANIRCTDGRTIMPDAFKHMDKKKVPLVWKHIHDDPTKVLGHAILEARPDGIYAYGYFNKKTKQGLLAHALVEHKDIESMSIYANQLKQRQFRGGLAVEHGMIREVSLVLSGANPDATIDFVSIKHEDGYQEDLDDEVIIHMNLQFDFLENSDDEDDEEDEDLDHAEGDGSGETVQDIYDTLTQKQKDVVSFLVSSAVEQASGSGDDSSAAQSDESNEEESVEHSDESNDEGDLGEDNPEGNLAHQKENDDMGTKVTHNIFDNSGSVDAGKKQHVMTHEDVKGIFANAKKLNSFKEAVQDYVLEHGITNIEVLFPDAKAISNTPEFDKRRTEWVSDVLNSTRHTPFARIKTLVADLTQDEARAKGYVKGNFKVEEWIGVTQRSTSPTTIYKKQKLDRDDILDVTDFDMVSWLMGEMRLMLEEELARAILIGDGRDPSSADKIKDPLAAADGAGIRSILNDHELYVTKLYVNVADANSTYDEVVDSVMNGMEHYKGTGTPVFYTTVKQLNKFKQAKDTTGRRLYETNAQVAEALGVSRIVTVEPMNEVSGLIGIICNLQDYNLGTNKGGDLTSFEDFDIDYNQHKYLLETRLSGALVKIKAALVILETTSTNVLAVPTKPTFVSSTGVVTIPTVTGVVYKDPDEVTIPAGAMAALDPGESFVIHAVPASGYYFSDTVADGPWTYKRPAA